MSALTILVVATCDVSAIEIVRQKNAATYISFPIVDADGDAVTGAAALDSEIDTFTDGVAPDGFLDCTNEATEVGTNGWYYLSLTAAEMNVDYAAIQIKTTTAGAKTQHILIRTMVGDPLNVATTDDGGAINVTTGAVDTVTTATNVTTVNGLAANVITATAINLGAITAAKFAAGAIDAAAIAAGAITSSEFAQSAADLVWSTAARTITGGTVTTNSDKTGYSLTTLESSILHSGTAQAGAVGSITLAAGASATSDLYKGLVVKIYGGTGAGQARTIMAYDGTTKVATPTWNWTTAPDITSTYAVLTTAHPSVNSSLQVTTTVGDPWATALPGSYGVGTAGKIVGDNLNATVSSRSTLTDAAVWSYVTRTLTSGGYSGLTAADVDLIWDEVQSGHITVGTFGKYLDEAISGLDDNPWDNTTRTLTSNVNLNDPTAAATAVAVWDELLAGHAITGSAGKKLSDLPTSGTGDWTSGEKTLIKQALGINDGDIDAGGDLDAIFLEIKKSRGR